MPSCSSSSPSAVRRRKTRTRDVLGMIVHARDDQGVALTDDEVLAHLYILLVAGHETTTTLAAWTLYLLATEPEQRARVEAELTRSSPAPPRRSPLRLPAICTGWTSSSVRPDDSTRLSKTSRAACCGMSSSLATRFLPARRCGVSLAGCHRMSRYFADPDHFDPDRFASPREEDRKSPYALVTFGGGPRLCIGVNFANIEVKAIATDVLRKVELTPTESDVPSNSASLPKSCLAAFRCRSSHARSSERSGADIRTTQAGITITIAQRCVEMTCSMLRRRVTRSAAPLRDACASHCSAASAPRYRVAIWR